ncbi:hypothetical protein [Paraburkholderia sp. J7]|uniref:hypothetical protein n=1 Tax=Paraburkholderia sp. J7 TaxID=2805438 RepID=UPI002AB779BF|nr:hypothetical protein [Paraburkholderia sp. J7]
MKTCNAAIGSSEMRWRQNCGSNAIAGVYASYPGTTKSGCGTIDKIELTWNAGIRQFASRENTTPDRPESPTELRRSSCIEQR